MSSNRSIKERAKRKIKYNYWHSVIISFLFVIIVSGGYKYNSFISDSFSSIGNDILSKNNIFIYNNIMSSAKKVIDITKNYKPTRGVLSVFFNKMNGSSSLVLGFVDAILEFITIKSIPKFFIKIFGFLLFILIYIFIQNIILVGKNRYYLEHSRYKKVNVDRIMFVYKVKKTINVAYIMLCKTIYLFWWFLTIVGGVIKYYSYFMIDYIVSENPTISRKDAFILSNEMMNGNKFNLFKMQLSFIGYIILGSLTFNISNIFYFDVYRESIYSEFYFNIRNEFLKKNKKKYRKYFKDEMLDGNKYNDGYYPNDKYFIPEKKMFNFLKLDYKVDYDVWTIILFFFTCAMIGWCWEVLLNLFVQGKFVNKGTMYGPWLPIYGYGATCVIVLFKKYRNKPWKIFLYSTILCGLIEYFTAVYLETFLHNRYWDYDGFFLNIQGRVCLEGLLVFGLGCMIFTYFLAPLLNNIYSKINLKYKKIIVIILVVLYLIDLCFTKIRPNSGEGITFYIMLKEWL